MNEPVMDIERADNIYENKNIINFFKKECVLVVALSLAIITSFISPPKLEYIDFKVLILLFNLMIIVAAFKELKVLDFIAVSILNRCTSYKEVTIAMVFTTFIISMIVTNDVALITFVPITLIIGQMVEINVLKIIVLQTIAANLGSSLTPMGNPQNLFLYTFYNIKPIEFFKITFPISILAIVFLLFMILKGKDKKLKFNLEDVTVKNRRNLICYSFVLVIILFSVFHVIDYRSAFLITVTFVGVLNKKLIMNVDYSLLLTFIGFFIFVGNISNMDIIKKFMETILNGKSNTYYYGILSSQIISNVPATMLLSGFTNNFKELLLGVNIGGMGTLIASLASVISYKLYCNEHKSDTAKYLKMFTEYNILGVILFTLIIKFIN